MGIGEDAWRAELRDTRKRLGLTQRALAEHAGVSWATLRAYENGHRSASRERLEALIAALKVPNATANAMRESAGFVPVNFLFAGDHNRNFFYTLEELPAAVKETPWPQFVVNDAFEVVEANAWVAAIWGIDWQHEKSARSRAQLNLLSVASDHHFADRLKNWDEIIGMFVSVFKAPAPTAYSLDEPTPYFNEVIAEFLNGDPVFLARLLNIWAATEPRDSKVRSSYPILWEDPEFGVMRLRGIMTNASYPDALTFNDWIPVDAETWQVLTKVKARQARDGKR
jgi:transcriptional regulator with XRE-family HTH domain